MKKQRLELDWIGKNNEYKLEPRILLESENLSFGDLKTENKLIFGDNLLALKALEQDFSGRFQCIYIDPPFNTGQAFEHYDDGVEHSLWLSLMRDRFLILRRLLSPNGTLWVHLDDNEVHYCRVLLDEIMGRKNFVSSIIWRAADSSNNDATQFSVDHNTILVYSANSDWKANALPRTEESNSHYSNPDNDPKGPWFSGNLSSPNPRENLRYEVVSPQAHKILPPANGWRWSKERLNEMISTGEVIFSQDGKRIIRKTYLANQKGLAPSTLWDNIEETGHNRQAKYELKKLFPDMPTSELFKTPKPEKLMERIIHIATKPGDWVLDSFAGSGTTGAVAHKMGRKWIMVELGQHCTSFIVPRLRKIMSGEDRGGISEKYKWEGGGGFKFFSLAPSLLQKDSFGNWIISQKYNAIQLAEAVCKHEGFKFWPDHNTYWKQGYSTEKDFIFITTEFLTADRLERISSTMKPDETLLICAKAFKVSANKYPNITIKKIPQMLLGRCEFGRDDYSLNIRTPAQDSISFDGAEA